MWISCMYICILFFLNFLTIYITTEYWAGFPVLYSRSSLITHLYIVSMMNICQSQSHSSSHHHPSSLVSIRLFSISTYSWTLITLITWIVENESLPKVMINYYIIYHLFYCNYMNCFYALYMICLLSSNYSLKEFRMTLSNFNIYIYVHITLIKEYN